MTILTRDLGRAPITSPKPPVLAKGAPSAATNKIFIVQYPLLQRYLFDDNWVVFCTANRNTFSDFNPFIHNSIFNCCAFGNINTWKRIEWLTLEPSDKSTLREITEFSTLPRTIEPDANCDSLTSEDSA